MSSKEQKACKVFVENIVINSEEGGGKLRKKHNSTIWSVYAQVWSGSRFCAFTTVFFALMPPHVSNQVIDLQVEVLKYNG